MPVRAMIVKKEKLICFAIPNMLLYLSICMIVSILYFSLCILIAMYSFASLLLVSSFTKKFTQNVTFSRFHMLSLTF